MPNNAAFIALDVGAKRIGLAIADSVARLPRPLAALSHTSEVYQVIHDLVSTEYIQAVVVGLPRDINGNVTEQTRFSQSFAAELTKHIRVPVYLQDEALTSQQAEKELIARGKPYHKGDIDSLSAVYILEDYLNQYTKVAV